MPDGEKKKGAEERIIRLFMEGSISSEVFESLIEELEESSEVSHRDADVVERLPSASGGEPSAPETYKKAVVYVRVSSSGQEAACVELAESLGYQVNDADVYRDVGSGGDADA